MPASFLNYPLITVITPVYKNRGYLSSAVLSVVEQTYSNIQYIIVDDGPYSVEDAQIEEIVSQRKADNSVELVIIHNMKNTGTAKSLNKALANAKGKYIFNIADDDCFYDGNVLAEWVGEFERTGAQIITARRAVYDESLTDFISLEPTDDEIEIIKGSTPQELFEAMAGRNIAFGCATAKTRALLKEIGGYDESYRIIEDYSSNMQVLRKGYAISFWDRVVVKYRYGGISSGTKVTAKYRKESDRLFRREILPFVENKAAAKKKYLEWKKDVMALSLNEAFKEQRQKVKNKADDLAVCFKFSVKHPYLMLKKLKAKLQNQKDRDKNNGAEK